MAEGTGRLRVAAALAVVYVVWGSTYLGIRVVVEEAPPLTAMGLRFLAACALLATVLALRGGVARLRVTGRQLLGCAFLGLMLPTLGNGLVSVGEDLGAPSGVTALLIAVTPLWIVLLRTAAGDRPPPRTLAGVVLGFAGLAVLVLSGRTDAAGHGVPLAAAGIIMVASCCWALGSYLQPRLWLPRDAFTTAVYQMLFGGLILLTLGGLTGEQFTGDYSGRTWLALGYLTVFGSMVAYTAYVWLLGHAPISLVATYAYVNPVVAVLLGWLVLAEPVTGAVVVGGTVVVAAVGLVISSERPPGRRGRARRAQPVPAEGAAVPPEPVTPGVAPGPRQERPGPETQPADPRFAGPPAARLSRDQKSGGGGI